MGSNFGFSGILPILIPRERPPRPIPAGRIPEANIFIAALRSSGVICSNAALIAGGMLSSAFFIASGDIGAPNAVFFPGTSGFFAVSFGGFLKASSIIFRAGLI